MFIHAYSSGSTADGPSPFHSGEQAMQIRIGRRDRVEAFGRRAIRPFMPDQHRAFFAQLPYLLIGTVDEHGQPWASILTGPPGFAHTPDSQTLAIDSLPSAEDPVAVNLGSDARIGVLGIELHSRRRNRLNGHIREISDHGFSVAVDQSFGNCPKFIHSRDLVMVRDPAEPAAQPRAQGLISLDAQAAALIDSARTFFVASATPGHGRDSHQGVDISHRGGEPGFILRQGNCLTIPDYAGNNLFNTLGNFLVNPRAGLLFLDFTSGDALQLTGRVTVLNDNDPLVTTFPDAKRAWQFTVEAGVWRYDAVPFRSVTES